MSTDLEFKLAGLFNLAKSASGASNRTHFWHPSAPKLKSIAVHGYVHSANDGNAACERSMSAPFRLTVVGRLHK